MIKEKELDTIDIENPNEKELEILLKLLDSRTKEGKNGAYVIAQEFHPEGGQVNRVITLTFAQNQYGQRDSAPFILCYFTRDYYKKIKAKKRTKII